MSDSTWRLIPLIEAPGNIQMAIDSWLLGQHLSEKHPPSLRFYTWSPPAISLGYHQHKYPEHWQNLIWRGQKIDLVRRPTGGRGVLHQGDLTYSVITSGLPGTRLQAYEKICEFLIQGFKSLGLDLHYGTAGRGYIHNPNCFGTATGADLVTVDGVKLIGSAQQRRGDAILQHGSIRLNPDPELFARVFGAENFTRVNLPENLGVENIIDALVLAASDRFGVEFDRHEFTQEEHSSINSRVTSLCL